MSLQVRRQTRFDGLSDTVDYYLYLFHERKHLSDAQLNDLKEKSDILRCFGEAGKGYYDEVQELFKMYHPKYYENGDN